MTAIPVPSSAVPRNPTLKAPEDETRALRKRVSILEKPTGLGSGFVTAADLTAGLATRAPLGLSNIAVLDFGSIGAGATAELTITVTGAVTGDTVAVGAPSTIESGLMWAGYVSAADTVTIRVHNTTAAPIDPASATWKASVIP